MTNDPPMILKFVRHKSRNVEKRNYWDIEWFAKSNNPSYIHRCVNFWADSKKYIMWTLVEHTAHSEEYILLHLQVQSWLTAWPSRFLTNKSLANNHSWFSFSQNDNDAVLIVFASWFSKFRKLPKRSCYTRFASSLVSLNSYRWMWTSSFLHFKCKFYSDKCLWLWLLNGELINVVKKL